MEGVDKFLLPFDIFCGHLIYFVAIWYILHMAVCYICWLFGTYIFLFRYIVQRKIRQPWDQPTYKGRWYGQIWHLRGTYMKQHILVSRHVALCRIQSRSNPICVVAVT
jgi:hypothetical protein